MKAELVFNRDEVGISEWEDRKDKEGDRSEDDGRANDRPSSFTERETYIDNYLYYGWRRVVDSLYRYITGL
jgi:hypothetical protein